MYLPPEGVTDRSRSTIVSEASGVDKLLVMPSNTTAPPSFTETNRVGPTISKEEEEEAVPASLVVVVE